MRELIFQALKKGAGFSSKPLDFILEAASRFELENNGFAGRRLTFP